jgi:hypothetical protein
LWDQTVEEEKLDGAMNRLGHIAIAAPVISKTALRNLRKKEKNKKIVAAAKEILRSNEVAMPE